MLRWRVRWRAKDDGGLGEAFMMKAVKFCGGKEKRSSNFPPPHLMSRDPFPFRTRRSASAAFKAVPLFLRRGAQRSVKSLLSGCFRIF